jgi:hypothetical protein
MECDNKYNQRTESPNIALCIIVNYLLVCVRAEEVGQSYELSLTTRKNTFLKILENVILYFRSHIIICISALTR